MLGVGATNLLIALFISIRLNNMLVQVTTGSAYLKTQVSFTNIQNFPPNTFKKNYRLGDDGFFLAQAKDEHIYSKPKYIGSKAHGC